MLDELWGHWQFNFWLGLASLATGLVVVTPCFLIPSWRRKILRSNLDVEGIGLIALIVLIVTIGCYNYFSAGNGT